MSKAIEYEICISCGKVTDVPKTMVVQKRDNYIGKSTVYRCCYPYFNHDNSE